jgi:hypothetical protein
MKRSIKLREQRQELPARTVRLRLPGALVTDLELYAQLYAEEHGHEIALPELVQAMVEQFLASDRAFGRYRRGRADPCTRPESEGTL